MDNKSIFRPAAAFVIAIAMLTTGCSGMLQKLPEYLSNTAETASSASGAEAPAGTSSTALTTATTTTTNTTTTTAVTTIVTANTTTSTKKTAATTKKQVPETLNGQDVVDYAKQFLGTPYLYGGNSLTKGVDCSGFTKLVYGHFGISLPRTASSQHKKGKIISYDELLPGDLCTTVYEFESQYTGHAAIYVGDGMVINALPEQGVVYTPLDDLYGEYVFHRIFNNTYGQ